MPFCPAIKNNDILKERKRSLTERTTDARGDKVDAFLSIGKWAFFKAQLFSKE